jgi:aldehyde dehydrogenase (NAD+)
MPTTSSPRPYDGFEKQFINGAWRPGHVSSLLKDTNPYTGKILLEIPSAEQTDVDEAYRSAAQAQPVWCKMLPFRRAAVMQGMAAAMQARRAEIVSWLVRESGSTCLKAEMEWESTHAIALECASMPHRVEGRVLPRDVPGKECRVYRKPVGVVGVIGAPLFATKIEAGIWPTSTISQCSICPTIPSAVKGIQVSAASACGPSRHLRRTNG